MKPFEIVILNEKKTVKLDVIPQKGSSKFDVYGAGITNTVWKEQTIKGTTWVSETPISRSLLKKIADKIEVNIKA